MPKLRKPKPSPRKPDKLLYRREDAAYALSLSVRSIDAMIADGRLTTCRFGRCVLIPAADVLRVAEKIIKSDMLEGTGRVGHGKVS